MPLEDFLAGTALFAAMLGAVGVATAIVVRRRLGDLDALEGTLTCVVIATSLLIGVHLVPMMLGVLDRISVLVACAVAVGGASLVRPVRAGAADGPRAHDPVATAPATTDGPRTHDPVATAPATTDGPRAHDPVATAPATTDGPRTHDPVATAPATTEGPRAGDPAAPPPAAGDSAEPGDSAALSPASGPVSWAIAAGACAFAAVAFIADLGRWAGDELVGVDPLTFHMPNIGRWIQTGSVWQIDQFVPLQSQGYYPNNGDVVLLGAVLPYNNDFLVRFPTALFLLLTGVAVTAIARELRAPPAAAILAGAACVAIPICGMASIPRALPDSLLWAMLACGVLFVLRHARSGRRSDLVLAGVALAVACGTKWYGLTSLAVVVVVWTVARLASREPVRGALRDGLLVGVIGALGTAVWLARNLIESGDPLFPVNIAPFGVTIFGAPPDVLRDLAGFTVFGYLDQPAILPQLAREVFEGLGLLPVVCLAGVLAAVVHARRPGGDRRVIAIAVAALLLCVIYAVTPFSALGLKDDPSLASVNTRYGVPALLLAAPLVAWVTGRLPRVLALMAQAGLAVATVWGAYEGFEVSSPREVVLALAALGLLGAAGWAAWRLRRRPLALVAGTLAAALLGVGAMYRIEQAVNTERYLEDDPAVAALLRLAPEGRRIAHAGDWSIGGLSPIWPSFGARVGNEVEYVGYFDHGWLRRYPDAASFAAALARGRYDALVVGRGFFPPQDTPEQRWAIAAGWRTIALSDRLRVMVAPGS